MAALTTNDNLLHFICAKCETHLSVEPSKAGVKATCPSCGKEITAPPVAKSPQTSNTSSLEKVKKAVESKPAKPEAKTSLQKETRKVHTAPVRVQAQPVNPKTGLTKAEEERGEFAAVVKLLVLGLLFLIAAGVAVAYFQVEIFEWLDANL